jgi:hypothetical protein
MPVNILPEACAEKGLLFTRGPIAENGPFVPTKTRRVQRPALSLLAMHCSEWHTCTYHMCAAEKQSLSESAVAFARVAMAAR